MNKYLEQLVGLSQIDQKIDGYAPRIDAINKDLNTKKQEIESFDADVAAIDEEIAEIKVQIGSTNVHIAEFNAKIKDVAKKSATLKTEKEIKALNLEEELAKDQLEAANEEIERLERIIATKEDNKTELAAKKETAAGELTMLEAKVADELDAIKAERDVIYADKEKLLAGMDKKVLTFYEKIRKWAKNSAVVPVRKQACYGCFMRINDKTYANVLKSDEIVTCPHCGRILYSEEAVPNSNEE